MSNLTGYKIKNPKINNGVAIDLINLYEPAPTNISEPMPGQTPPATLTTNYKAITNQTDLGGVFSLYENLGLSPTMYRGLPCGFKLSDGTDIGTLFIQKNPLLFHYRFNQGDINASGLLANYASGTAKYDATVSGATINTSLQKFGTGCLYLNGSSQFVTLPSYTSDLNGISICCWVKTTGMDAMIFNSGNAPTAPATVNETFGITVNLWYQTVYRLTQTTKSESANFFLNDGNWNHIVWTLQCTNTVTNKGTWRIFVNGSNLAEYTNFYYPSAIERVNNYFGKGFGILPYFNGYLDEFRY